MTTAMLPPVNAKPPNTMTSNTISPMTEIMSCLLPAIQLLWLPVREGLRQRAREVAGMAMG